MVQTQYCRAIVEDRIIFFELTTAQFYGQGNQTVPIYWEINCQGFSGEMDLADILELEILSETDPIAKIG